jgi:hypothetical protein
LKGFHFKLKFVHGDKENDKFLCFDITSRKSFDAVLERHMGGFKYGRGLLIGLKGDLDHRREVSVEEAKELAFQLGISYVEVNSKSGNVDRPFVSFLKKLVKIRLFNHQERERKYLEELKFDVKGLREKESQLVCLLQ